MSASYECYAPARLIGEYLARQIETVDGVVDSGVSGGDLATALRAWYASPAAFFAQAWCEVIAQK